MCEYYFQDGAQFYESKSGELIAEYKELFEYECDFTAALLAYLAFSTEFPQYICEPLTTDGIFDWHDVD